MSTLLIVGAGGHGRAVADTALSMGAWTSVCFVDDRPDLTDVLGFKVIGTCADLEKLVLSYPSAALGIGTANARLKLLERCKRAGFKLPPVVHRSAAVSPYASLGDGVLVKAQAAIDPGVVIGAGCIVNLGATVSHDCELGSGVHVCPGANVAGNVKVGARTWIGINASIKQGVTIGNEVTIGAGAAVISNVDSGTTVVGVPARPR